ncbi:MAG: ribose-phosphate diphosphokinase [Candidatus Paceibacterota bacterium]
MGEEKAVILADPAGKCYGFALKVFKSIENKNEKDFLMDFVNINFKEFRDKEEKIKILDTVRKKNCFFIHDSNKEPNTWFTELAFVNEALRGASAKDITNILPYLKFSRQDRKDEARVALNAKAVAKSISSYANKVMTVDVHALQIQGFYDIPFDPLYSFPTVVDYLCDNHRNELENLVIMSPDAGGAPRARSFKNKLENKKVITELAIGYKERPRPGEVSEEYVILGNVDGKNVLIIDDIIDSGNTLNIAAKKLKEKGAKQIWAYATHGLFTEGVEKMTDVFDKVMVSDTLYVEPHAKLETISIANLIGEAIYRNAKGYSLSELFK